MTPGRRPKLRSASAVEKMGMDHFEGIGEAAFYGPKLDFIVRDALDREWQLGHGTSRLQLCRSGSTLNMWLKTARDSGLS